VTDDREIDLPETVDEAAEVLGDESFFVPTEQLPDDPDALKEYVDELHLHLARASRVREQQRKQLEQRAEEVRETTREHQERMDAVDEMLGRDSDDD
jgi:FtsZ-binding cell division protein ZapB